MLTQKSTTNKKKIKCFKFNPKQKKSVIKTALKIVIFFQW